MNVIWLATNHVSSVAFKQQKFRFFCFHRQISNGLDQKQTVFTSVFFVTAPHLSLQFSHKFGAELFIDVSIYRFQSALLCHVILILTFWFFNIFSTLQIFDIFHFVRLMETFSICINKINESNIWLEFLFFHLIASFSCLCFPFNFSTVKIVKRFAIRHKNQIQVEMKSHKMNFVLVCLMLF